MTFGDVVVTAGLAPAPVPQDPRKESIRQIRKTLRDAAATDDQVEDALEALLELTKE